MPVDAEQGTVARSAFGRLGKGRHIAGLNYGDCFSDALAAATGEPLLFKGGPRWSVWTNVSPVVSAFRRTLRVFVESAVRNRMSLRKTVLIRVPQPPPPINKLCHCTDYGFAPDIRFRPATDRVTVVPAVRRRRHAPAGSAFRRTLRVFVENAAEPYVARKNHLDPTVIDSVASAAAGASAWRTRSISTRDRSGLLVLCSVLLAGCTAPSADSIFGRGGEVQWIDVARGRLKAQVYSTTPLSARPTLVIVVHGDIFDPAPSYQYAFAQALIQGFDAPAMPDTVRARLGAHPPVNDAVAAGLLRPGYTDNAGDRSDGQRGEARGDNYTAEVVDAVATAARALAQRFTARRVVLVGHSGGATIAAIVLGRHPEVADAALLVACGCGETRSLQPLDVTSRIRRDVTVRLLVGENDRVTPPGQSRRYAQVLSKHGVDAQLSVLPALGHNIMFTQPVFDETARLTHAARSIDDKDLPY